jgi:hypothetical protein
MREEMENYNVGYSTIAIESIVKEKIRLEEKLEIATKALAEMDQAWRMEFSGDRTNIAAEALAVLSKINGGE